MGRVTATIQQQDHLPLVLECFADGRVKLAADGAFRAAGMRPVAQVDDPDLRQWAIFHPAGHRDQLKLSLLGTIPTF